MTVVELENIPVNIDLSGNVYLITGAANGIGRSLSLQLATLEATVILLDKDDFGLNQVYDEIIALGKGEPVLVHQDLTLLTQSNCDTLLSQIQNSCGGLNGLIHCAAEPGHLSPVEHYSDEDWSTVIRANLHSPYLLTRTLRAALPTEKPGMIIFSTSEQAIKSTAYWGAFAVAQQGLKALTETWAAETENSPTSIVLLDPGKVKTRFLASLYPGINPNRFPDSDAIARAYVCLLSGQIQNTHGKIFQVRDMKLQRVEL